MFCESFIVVCFGNRALMVRSFFAKGTGSYFMLIIYTCVEQRIIGSSHLKIAVALSID